MKAVVTEPNTLGPWIPKNHNNCIKNTHTKYPGKPVMMACNGAMIVAITLKIFCPTKLLKINPTTDTTTIVTATGNNTAKD